MQSGLVETVADHFISWYGAWAFDLKARAAMRSCTSCIKLLQASYIKLLQATYSYYALTCTEDLPMGPNLRSSLLNVVFELPLSAHERFVGPQSETN